MFDAAAVPASTDALVSVWRQPRRLQPVRGTLPIG